MLLPAARAGELGPRLHAEAAALLHRPVAGGLGLPAPLEHASRTAAQAASAARTAQSAPGKPSQFAAYEGLPAFSLVLSQLSHAELEGLAHSLLGELDAHDAAHPSATLLVDALAAFLRSGGQTEATAIELGIHRHTMRARLAKIAALTGRDLASAADRAELWLALQAREAAGSRSAKDAASRRV